MHRQGPRGYECDGSADCPGCRADAAREGREAYEAAKRETARIAAVLDRVSSERARGDVPPVTLPVRQESAWGIKALWCAFGFAFGLLFAWFLK